MQKEQQLLIDLSGRGGLANKFAGDIGRYNATILNLLTDNVNNRYIAEDNQFVSGYFNPVKKYGFLSPSVGTLLTCTAGTSFTANMAATQVDEINGNVYFLEASTKIQMATGLSDLTFSDDKTISGAVYTDAAIYDFNGVRSLYFVYNKSSETKIGKKNLTSNAYADEILGSSGTITGNFTPIDSTGKLIPAGDGYMYFLNGNYVHKIDGTTVGGANGTITQNVLTAPTYYKFSHGIDYRQNLYLVIQKNTIYTGTTLNTSMFNSECGVYIWNRQASFINTADFIPLFGCRDVRAIFVAPNGKIRVFCTGSDRTTQIREFNGSTFEIIRTLGYEAQPQYEDSVAVSSLFTIWLGKDGNVYYFGNDNPREKDILFIAGNVGTINSANTGSIAFTSSGGTIASEENKESLYLSWRDNSAYNVKKFYPFAGSTLNGSNVNPLQGDVYTSIKYLPKLSTLNHIDVYLAQYPHSSSLTTSAGIIKIYFNNSSTAWASKTVTRGDIAKGFFPIEVNKPYITSIQLEFEFPTGTAIEEFIMNPGFAVINYTPSTTIK